MGDLRAHREDPAYSFVTGRARQRFAKARASHDSVQVRHLHDRGFHPYHDLLRVSKTLGMLLQFQYTGWISIGDLDQGFHSGETASAPGSTVTRAVI
jgi:hypothetical protein